MGSNHRAMGDPEKCGRPLRGKDEPDDLVRLLVCVLDYMRWGVPYEWFAARARHKGRSLSPNFVAFYAAAWLTVLLVIFLLVPQIDKGPSWVEAVVSVLPILAVVEITRWWLSVLLNRTHDRFVSFERNLLYLFVNLFEVVLAGAVLLRLTSDSKSADDAVFTSFFLATQVSNGPHRSTLHDVAQIFTAGCSLVLLAGGLVILLGGMGPSFHEGDYEGPWELPRRRRARGVAPTVTAHHVAQAEEE